MITPGAVFPECHGVQSNEVIAKSTQWATKEDVINQHCGLGIFKLHIVS